MVTIQDALINDFPECLFSITGFDYSNLLWNEENTTPKPTETELNVIVERLNQELPMKLLRQERNKKLKDSDIYATSDWNFSNKSEWLTYRQALRDLPSTSSPSIVNGVLTGVTWPSIPSS